MRDPANDDVLLGADDAEEARVAARYAKIRLAARNYIGRTDLLELGIATCRELRAAQCELNAAARAKINARLLLNRAVAKSDELSAIEEAMDEETKVKLWDAISRLSVAR